MADNTGAEKHTAAMVSVLAVRWTETNSPGPKATQSKSGAKPAEFQRHQAEQAVKEDVSAQYASHINKALAMHERR